MFIALDCINDEYSIKNICNARENETNKDDIYIDRSSLIYNRNLSTRIANLNCFNEFAPALIKILINIINFFNLLHFVQNIILYTFNNFEFIASHFLFR